MLEVENNVVWNDVTGMRLFDLYEPLKLDGAVNYIECHAHAYNGRTTSNNNYIIIKKN